MTVGLLSENKVKLLKMNDLAIKSKSKTNLDFLTIGEILLRFDSGIERIHAARNFSVWDGGGEYNVAKNLANVFGLRTSIVTALKDNSLGRLAEDFARQGRVSTEHIIWKNDKIEKTRNGIYFIERGFGLRNPTSCFDRDFTAISKLSLDDIDLEKIFDETNPRCFHTGGIFAGLSDSTFEIALESLKIAKKKGIATSFDLNYRDSLWKDRGGIEKANELNRKLLQYVDVVFGIPDFKASFIDIDILKFREAADKLREEVPNLKIIVNTLRQIVSANFHNLTALCSVVDQEQIYKSKDYINVEVFDRVGSGDAFAAGFLYGLLEKENVEYAIECGTAHACLVMTTPGDNSNAKLSEIEELMRGEGLKVER